MTIVAIIPARGGSKGVPRKNSRNMNGKPLVAWSIEQALAVPEVSRVIVSTDSENIAEIARQAGAEVPGLRPAHLAQDDTPTEPVLIHAIKTWCGDDIPGLVMLLQPTSPLRLPDSIGKARNCAVTRRNPLCPSAKAMRSSGAILASRRPCTTTGTGRDGRT